MSDSSTPLPKKGDQLFKADVDGWHNACLDYPNVGPGIYAEGYKRAGDIVVEHIKQDSFGIDFLVFPVVFLYRQYIELRLKEIIKYGNQLLDIPEGFPANHKIDKLWEQCREILQEVWPETPSEELDVIEELIHQFSETDPISMVFRYPTDKGGKPSLPPELTHINLRNLSEVIEKMSPLLDGASRGISEYLSDKHEMQANML